MNHSSPHIWALRRLWAHRHMGPTSFGGLRSFARIFSLARQPWKTHSITYHISTWKDYICVMHVASDWKKKKKKEKKIASCLNTKWFSPNITCFLPEYGHLKNPRGASAPCLLCLCVRRTLKMKFLTSHWQPLQCIPEKTEPWINGMMWASCGVYDYYHIYFMKYD